MTSAGNKYLNVSFIDRNCPFKFMKYQQNY